MYLMSGASAERVTVIAKYFWPLAFTMLPDKKALDVVGVIGNAGYLRDGRENLVELHQDVIAGKIGFRRPQRLDLVAHIRDESDPVFQLVAHQRQVLADEQRHVLRCRIHRREGR